MKGFVQDIESLSVKNDNFRQVLYTAKNSQLVLMSLKPQEDIGAAQHTTTNQGQYRTDQHDDDDDLQQAHAGLACA